MTSKKTATLQRQIHKAYCKIDRLKKQHTDRMYAVYSIIDKLQQQHTLLQRAEQMQAVDDAIAKHHAKGKP